MHVFAKAGGMGQLRLLFGCSLALSGFLPLLAQAKMQQATVFMAPSPPPPLLFLHLLRKMQHLCVLEPRSLQPIPIR